MRYAKINSLDVTNGENVGVSVFVQGCHFHCKGCFNPETWNFNGGKEWTAEVEKTFIGLISKPYIKRVSILGGEPLADENLELTQAIIDLISQVSSNTQKQIKIWLYTGYTLEQIQNDVVTCNKTVFTYSDNEYSDQNINEAIKYKISLFNSDNRIKRNDIALMCDYIVDGRFEIDKQDLTYSKVKFAGSTNQRIIDVQKTLKKGEVVLYE